MVDTAGGYIECFVLMAIKVLVWTFLYHIYQLCLYQWKRIIVLLNVLHWIEVMIYHINYVNVFIFKFYWNHLLYDTAFTVTNCLFGNILNSFNISFSLCFVDLAGLVLILYHREDPLRALNCRNLK